MTTPIGPLLGRLAAPPTGAPFESTRLAMVDALVALHADGALDGRAWVAVWQDAMTTIRDQVIAEGAAALRRAAVRSRYPAASLAALVPDAAASEALLQRLLAEGVALEALEAGDDSLATQRQRGAALETGWDAASRVARIEAGRLAISADRVMAWRRPWRPLAIVAVLLVSLTAILAAMIGGLLPSPGWFRPAIDWFWGLPWP